MISVNNLTKKFGDNRVVDGVSFKVEKGEMLGLLGPNGAGKTTTMRIMTGFMPPTEGSVTVDGLDAFEHAYEVKKKIGYMPEHPPLYYDMTSYECLTFVAEVHGLRGRIVDREIERVSELCGITEMLRRLTGHLSKGYRQRVGLAQALIHNPEILVLDEPTAGLDPRQIIEIRELIKKLGQERTVVLSSHILHEVTNVCKRVAIMNKGRLVAVDTIESLSKSLKMGREIILKVAKPEVVNTEELSSLQGVNSIEKCAQKEFRIFISTGNTVIEDISSSVVNTGAGLLEIKEQSMSLEDIFLKVVSGENLN